MRTVVVDSHNEVLPYWLEEYLRSRLPLVVVRIDKHHDMSHECPVLPAREGRSVYDYFAKITPYVSEYAKRKLNEGNFTCPAFHYGIVGALYHCDPRKKLIDAYGRVSGRSFSQSPKTTIKSVLIGGRKLNRIFWDSTLTKLRLRGGKAVPGPENISLELFREDLEKAKFPVIICFDLDGIYGIDDTGRIEELMEKRLDKVKILLDCISSPVLACIARSQTPRAYVPPELVDHLQRVVQKLMERRCHWPL